MNVKKENVIKSAEAVQKALQDNVSFDNEAAIEVVRLLTVSYLKICRAIEIIEHNES